MVRKHEKPLEQVIIRYEEFLTFSESKLNSTSLNSDIIYKNPHNNGPLLQHFTTIQYQLIIKNGIKINLKSKSDCYIGFEKDKKLCIFKVLNICQDSISGRNIFLSKQFNTIFCFFEKPINSLKLGIAIGSDLSEHYTTIDIELTKFSKYMIFLDNNNNKNVAYPILHNSDV